MIGGRLAALEKARSEVVSVRPTNGEAALLFLANLDTQDYDGPLRPALSRLLNDGGRNIEWRLRQVGIGPLGL